MKNISIREINGYYPEYSKSVFIDPQACVSGNVILKNDSSVFPMVSIRGDLEQIIIGERTNIQDNSCIHTTRNTKGTILGNDVTIGHGVILHSCIIKNRVLVGMGCIILDNVVIESDVMIGAGTLIPPNKTLESGFMYYGNPFKKARKLKNDELKFLLQSAKNYVVAKNEHLKMIEKWTEV